MLALRSRPSTGRNVKSPSTPLIFADAAFSTGVPDVIHYNVASLRLAGWQEQPVSEIVGDLAGNAGGALATVHAAAPAMAGRGSGTILITGGGFARYPNPELLTLSMGKAALRNMVLAIAPGLAESGVHMASVSVNDIVPADAAGPIAEIFWNLHNEPAGAWSTEVDYNP